jgi:hypothetical protein
MWEGHADGMAKVTASLGHGLKMTDVALERPLPKLEGNVVVHGSFQLARKVHAETDWRPGVICTLGNYLWSSYAPRLSKGILLNDDWKVSTTPQFVKLAEAHLLEDCFVRPDAGDKPFGGTPFFGDRTLWQAIARMFLRDGGDIPIIVSPLKTVMEEYRIVVVDGRAVAGSMYMRDGLIDIVPAAPHEAYGLAERAASEWMPDKAFVIDVANTPEGYKVVEYNAFSTADWYGCELTPILSGIGRMLEGT